jgi:pyruvate,water dikinase
MDVTKVPQTKTKIFVNIGVPEKAYTIGQLPVDGVGLARLEFIIASHITEHPLAMIRDGRAQEYVDKLAEGIAKFAAAFYPRPVILRFSDFKTNEYASLKGGKEFEPDEANPMIGWRGAARYVDPVFEPAFRLECRAVKKVREQMGLTNVIPMIPFCRTIEEGKKTLAIMAEEGLKRGVAGLQVWVMAEVPSNIMLADEFSKIFDGHSIGSNDLTQLCMGIDRDSAKLAATFDERNPAVLRMISRLIRTAHEYGTTVSICGEAPSYYKEFTKFLVEYGIDSISVNPEVAVETRLLVHEVERELGIAK